MILAAWDCPPLYPYGEKPSRPIRLMKRSQRIAYFREEPHVDPWVLWEGENGPWRAMWARMDFVGPPQLAPP